MSARPPETIEGWYALHQIWRTDQRAARDAGARKDERRSTEMRLAAERIAAPAEGWSAFFRLVGGGADWLFVHLRPSLDALRDVEARISGSRLRAVLEPVYDYLSVAEAGLYRATAEVSAEHEPGSDAYRSALDRRIVEERDNPYVRRRLYPEIPDGMRYISFYPMSKRRAEPDNWYTLPLAERSRLMLAHGQTGRAYAGRVSQMITGSVGLDDWEWGVTLFAHDPLDFKRIVTEMRYDEASARYAEFGPFWTGIRCRPAELGMVGGAS